jgi:hypothetical protein
LKPLCDVLSLSWFDKSLMRFQVYDFLRTTGCRAAPIGWFCKAPPPSLGQGAAAAKRGKSKAAASANPAHVKLGQSLNSGKVRPKAMPDAMPSTQVARSFSLSIDD